MQAGPLAATAVRAEGSKSPAIKAEPTTVKAEGPLTIAEVREFVAKMGGTMPATELSRHFKSRLIVSRCCSLLLLTHASCLLCQCLRWSHNCNWLLICASAQTAGDLCQSFQQLSQQHCCLLTSIVLKAHVDLLSCRQRRTRITSDTL